MSKHTLAPMVSLLCLLGLTVACAAEPQQKKQAKAKPSVEETETESSDKPLEVEDGPVQTKKKRDKSSGDSSKRSERDDESVELDPKLLEMLSPEAIEALRSLSPDQIKALNAGAQDGSLVPSSQTNGQGQAVDLVGLAAILGTVGVVTGQLIQNGADDYEDDYYDDDYGDDY